MIKRRFYSIVSVLLSVFWMSVIILVFSSCKSRNVYVPVETIKNEKEYIDRWQRDSIHIKDSIIISKEGDTVYVRDYKYVYKDKFVKDSIFVTDSIKVEVPVEVIKEVNHLNNWQMTLMCIGGVFIGYIGFVVFKKIKM